MWDERERTVDGPLDTLGFINIIHRKSVHKARQGNPEGLHHRPCFIHVPECPINRHLCRIGAVTVWGLHPLALTCFWGITHHKACWDREVEKLLRTKSLPTQRAWRSCLVIFQKSNRPRCYSKRTQGDSVSHKAIWRIHQLLVAMLDQITQSHRSQRSSWPGSNRQLLVVCQAELLTWISKWVLVARLSW